MQTGLKQLIPEHDNELQVTEKLTKVSSKHSCFQMSRPFHPVCEYIGQNGVGQKLGTKESFWCSCGNLFCFIKVYCVHCAIEADETSVLRLGSR